MSDTPRTDAVKFAVSIFENGKFKRHQTVTTVEHSESLERENQQLRVELKQCAQTLEKCKRRFQTDPFINAEYIGIIEQTLEMPSIQAALKDNEPTNKPQ